MKHMTKLQLLLITAPLVLALFSFFVLAKTTSSVDFHKANIESLENKKDKVMELTAASAAASAAITLIPGDVATPIASELADLSSKFVIVICAIYVEKYLLTITGYVTFAILIPISCIIFSIGALLMRPPMFRTSFRIGLLGLAFFFVIPASLGISRMIENTYHESIEATIESATQTAEEIEAENESIAESAPAENESIAESAPAENESIAESAPAENESEPEKPSVFNGTIGSWLNSVTESGRELTENITNSVNQSTEAFRQLFNNMLEAFAVMLVTSCVIPVLVLLLFVWMIKLIIGSGTGPMPPAPKP